MSLQSPHALKILQSMIRRDICSLIRILVAINVLLPIGTLFSCQDTIHVMRQSTV